MPPRECVRRLERWAAAEGASIERLRYARPEAGGEVDAWRISPPAPRMRVVAAHGAGNDALYPQIALFKALVRAGAEAFAFDADGHGAASTTVFRPDTVRGAIKTAVREAERGRPELPLHLAGHSFGGSLVLDALATGAVPHARSAIVLSAPVDVSLDLRTAVGELAGFLRTATLAQREHYGLWGIVPAAGPLKRRAYPIRGATEDGAPFAYVAAIRRLLADLDLAAAAPRVDVPVLLVYGTRDRLVPLAQGRMLAERLPAAELVEVVGATHWSAALADEAIGRAAAWVRAHTPAAAAASVLQSSVG